MKFEINNVDVRGIAQSVKASGYPMAINIDNEVSDSDFERMYRLAGAKSSSGHDCALKGVIVQANVTAPQYWWLQFGRYHFADIVSSQSKMHKITEMKLGKQCNLYVNYRVAEILEDLIIKYKNGEIGIEEVMSNVPMGLMLTARITTNYLQLKSIYNQRRNHKLEEWQIFCDWIEGLSFSEWITGVGENELD